LSALLNRKQDIAAALAALQRALASGGADTQSLTTVAKMASRLSELSFARGAIADEIAGVVGPMCELLSRCSALSATLTAADARLLEELYHSARVIMDNAPGTVTVGECCSGRLCDAFAGLIAGVCLCAWCVRVLRRHVGVAVAVHPHGVQQRRRRH
jgi:hypothetical protein